MQNENQKEVKEFQQVKGMSPITAMLIDRLKNGKPNDTIDEDEWGKETNTELGTEGRNYSHLMSAIKFCEREHGVVWQRVRKTSIIKCLNASERVNVGRQKLEHIRKTGKRTVRVVASADMRELSNEEKTEAYKQIAHLGAICTFAGSKTQLVGNTTAQIE